MRALFESEFFSFNLDANRSSEDVLEFHHKEQQGDVRIREDTRGCPVLSVDPIQITNAEVAVSVMVFRLPPKHGNSKLQTTLLAIGPTSFVPK